MKYTQENKEEAIQIMLEMIGEDREREGLIDTPKRVVRMWKEIFRGYDPKQKPKVTTFNNGSDGVVYDEMINDEGAFYSHCEHHMVPFFGKYYFAYLPNPKGKLLGLSKVARVVDYFSAKLQIQERLVHEIVEYLWEELSITKEGEEIIEPLAMGLVMDGSHLCKEMRGAKKKGTMRCTKLKGVFKTNPSARAEFFNSVNKR